jgi:uncharacterized protein involved in exopolysaccharide biosynthesis
MVHVRPRKFSEIIGIIWRRKSSVVLISIAILLSLWPIIERLPNSYESRGLVSIASPAGLETAIISGQITSATQQINSQSLLESIVKKCIPYPELKNTDDAVSKLRKKIKIETKFRGYYPDGPESLTITYRHPDRKKAQLVLNELFSIFSSSNLNIQQELSNELSILNNSIAKTEGEINNFVRTAEKQKITLPSRTIVDTVAVNSQRHTTTSGIEALNDKYYGYEQQIATLKKQISTQQKSLNLKASSTSTNSQVTFLQLKKSEIEALLASYAIQYTDKNPKVLQVRSQLADINRQISAATATTNETVLSPVAALEERELRDQQRELARLEIEFEVTKREIERKKQYLSSLPTVDGATAFTKTETIPSINQTQDLSVPAYTNLVDRQKTLQLRRDALQRQLAGGSGIFHVVDQPTISEAPVAPDRSLLKIIGMALAMSLGLVSALVLEIPRTVRIQDEKDIEYFLGTPILAAIPETLTAPEGNRTKRLQIAKWIIKLFLVSLLIPLFYLLLKGLGIYQLFS